jgi:hypothetical protein
MSRTPRLYLVVLAVLVLSACSAAAGNSGASGTNSTSPSAGAAIELAVSETCTEGSDPECVSVNGENVLLPATFERAGVQDSGIAGNGLNAVNVTFSEDGAVVLHSLTEKAAGAGSSARLVLKIGGELKAAVVVMAALDGDQVQFSLAPDDSAQQVVDQIQEG